MINLSSTNDKTIRENMIEKRYQVFISSTYEDLIPERQQVMHSLLSLKCIPVGMELFPAGDETQWDLIKKVIKESDYYVVIIGGRYGSIGPDGLSYTEMEYRYAEEENIPTIAFTFHDVGKLPREKTELDPFMMEKLTNFRKHARRKYVKDWTSPEDLGMEVVLSMANLMNSKPRIGWVKADNLPDSDILIENINLRKRIEELESKILSTPHSSSVVDELAQGNDELEINYTINGYRDQKNVKDPGKEKVRWNEIIRLVLPNLLPEGPEYAISSPIANLIESKVKSNYTFVREVTIADNIKSVIKVQLKELGIITPSLKSGGDNLRIWKLTPLGESMLARFYSIKRPIRIEDSSQK